MKPRRCSTGCTSERLRRYRNSLAGGSYPPNGASSRTLAQARAVSVLPFASTGTGVSSPCRRCAPSTCAAINSCNGGSATAHAPTRSASVETLSSTFSGVAFALAVQRLMLPVLLEHDCGEQVRTHPAPRQRVVRRWRLRELLEVATSELLGHRLNHLPRARDHFQRLGNVIADLRSRCDPQHAHEAGGPPA